MSYAIICHAKATTNLQYEAMLKRSKSNQSKANAANQNSTTQSKAEQRKTKQHNAKKHRNPRSEDAEEPFAHKMIFDLPLCTQKVTALCTSLSWWEAQNRYKTKKGATPSRRFCFMLALLCCAVPWYAMRCNAIAIAMIELCCATRMRC